ncbi:type VI secretion system baseplate subunit TssK [Photobacterium sanctipauli]|uniref:Type VI secretion system baseplate subunit TssK n=1 Tax=Photobacterium sanctipauli TaxID=1342794 RepID=A0A2T3NYP8_9GAMM|nr:type VI secretion system baseplate subunit TssK [Photobacterium sanctipauli]PSW21406.1 type VI secretion system baseplate subunit TssK [Photobacterium sanctipauli]
MKRQNKVVWKEGMFIAPQHFQQQDRHTSQYVQKYVSLTAGGQCYGVSTLDVEPNYLKLGKFGVANCSGIFPDGTLFNSAKELLLEVPEGTLNQKVYLALPLSVDGENEYGEVIELRRYAVSNNNLFDVSDAGQSAIEAQLAEPNVRLVIEGEDVTGLALIPIARILERKDDGEVLLDKSFIPTCLQYGASLLLKERLKELYILSQVRAKDVVERIGAGQKAKSELSLMREFLWLQTLNRWLPWLHIKLEHPETRIEELYEGLIAYSAELDSFTPVMAAEPKSLARDHLASVFAGLFTELRDKLSMVQSDNVTEFDWDKALFSKRRLLRLSLPNIHQLDGKRFVLSVQSSIGTAELANTFPSCCTLSGLSQIVELVRNGQSGVSVHALPVAPTELKAQADVAYFEVDVSHDYWQQLKTNREPIALHIDSRIPELSLKLYALG